MNARSDMQSAFLMCTAWLVGLLGFALLSLSQERHFESVFSGGIPTHSETRRLRAIGFLLVGLELGVCIASEGAGFGSLLWMVLISADAAIVALVLAWKPHWLRPLRILRSGSARGRT
ncbi:MAG: DUF3325 domain-containing protein [Acidovorax sp.]|uniref:DUF3325 domain-containing protein n=1 Tax=Acidovorax sp. TaxID=1872122 RepID=UPI00391C5DA9